MAAGEPGINLDVVKLPQAERGHVPPPRRRVVARRFAWLTRLRRLARDFERMPETLAGPHSLASAAFVLAEAGTPIRKGMTASR